MNGASEWGVTEWAGVIALFVGAAAFVASANTLFLLTKRWEKPRSRWSLLWGALLALSCAAGLVTPLLITRHTEDAGLVAAEFFVFLVAAAAVFFIGRRAPAGGEEMLPGLIGTGSIVLGAVIAGSVEWIIRGPGPTPLLNAALIFLLVLLIGGAALVARKTLT